MAQRVRAEVRLLPSARMGFRNGLGRVTMSRFALRFTGASSKGLPRWVNCRPQNFSGVLQ